MVSGASSQRNVSGTSSAAPSIFPADERTPVSRQSSTLHKSVQPMPDGVSQASEELDTSFKSHAPSIIDDAEHASVLTMDDPALGDGQRAPPHEDRFELLSNTLSVELEATGNLIESLGAGGASGDRQGEVRDALRSSLRLVSEQYKEHLAMVAAREKWYARRYEAELDAKALWEQTTIQAAAQHSEVEQELERVAREAERRKRALKTARSRAQSTVSPPAMSPTAGQGDMLAAATSRLAVEPNRPTLLRIPSSGANSVAAEDDDVSSDDSDEFFEAVEAGAVNVRVDTPIAAPQSQEWPQKKPAEDQLEPYRAYEKLRDRLPITSDDRPPVSLWAILKGSIGKDLTRISASMLAPYGLTAQASPSTSTSRPACFSAWPRTWSSPSAVRRRRSVQD